MAESEKLSKDEIAGSAIRNDYHRGISARKNSQEILKIAQRMDTFISDNGWSWCDMNQVYRILKVLYE